MRKMFEKIDVNFDGKLSLEEMIEGFKMMNIVDYKEEAERIFNNIDIDKNNYIEFSEWCTAAMDKRIMLSDEKLKAAFDIFDINGDGSISYDELKQIMNKNE
jgi:calcium-dependent protein kinase